MPNVLYYSVMNSGILRRLGWASESAEMWRGWVLLCAPSQHAPQRKGLAYGAASSFPLPPSLSCQRNSSSPYFPLQEKTARLKVSCNCFRLSSLPGLSWERIICPDPLYVAGKTHRKMTIPFAIWSCYLSGRWLATNRNFA